MKKTKYKGKIDVVVKYFYPIAAGIEVNTMETYSVLARSGWDVTFHVSNDLYLEKNILPKYEKIRGIKVKRYRFVSDTIGYMPDINWNKTNIVCLHNFNIYHFRILIKILFMKIMGRKRFGLAITPHGGFNPEWSIFSKIQRIIKPIYHYTIGTLLINTTADGVRGVSEWEKKEMIKKGVNKDLINVITNGLENEAFMDVEKKASKEIKKMVKGFGKYIIQVGRIYPIKNYETVIKALPKIDKNIKYVIVGQEEKSTEYKESLIKLASNLGVNNRLIFAGVIRGVDKYYLIKKSKLMVHMAIWESFCNVVHEGLSQGLVCIVANNTALPLLIRDRVNGYVVDTHDSVNLSKRINYVLKNFNNSKIKNIRKLNREFGKDSSWENVSSKMEKFYQGIIYKISVNHNL